MTPRLSVILPVYNAGPYLEAAVQSVLDQTFKDFELIAINDGSKDDSLRVLQQFKDPRIRVYTQENKGLIATLNRGISLSAGEFIARMDQDDISMPDRFEKQVAFLDANPEVGLLGTTFAVQIDETVTGIAAVLLHDHDLRRQLLYKNPFGHGTVMFRRALGEKLDGWYSETAENAEDFELWSRVAAVTKIANLPEPLYIWRDNPTGISSSRRAKQQKMTLDIAKQNRANAAFRLDGPHGQYRNEKVIVNGQEYTARRGRSHARALIALAGVAIRQRRPLLAFDLLTKSILR